MSTSSDPCHYDPELFFSKARGQQVEAQRICKTKCSRLEACFIETMELEQQLGEVVHGVRAGTTEAERRRAFKRSA